MSPNSIPPHLVAFLSSPQTPQDAAIDGLEEWILHRRGKGDTLFEVSVGLAELEDKTPHHLSSVFDRARNVTNVPQPSDLTPPMGPFPLARSASPATIVHHLLSQPMPSIEHSREVILEFCLAREQKHREKKPGRGGKGTLGRDGFEDVGSKLGEVEQGLRGGGQEEPHYKSPYPSPVSAKQDLDEPRKVGLMLVLALRMSLSYFTLKELADQLLLLGIADAERALVQHIRRRVQGEGRFGVGRELEYIESLTLHRRPALRPAFRSAKLRTTLSPQPIHPIVLPAPTKSSVIKLLSSHIKDVDEGRTVAIPAQGLPGLASSSPAADRSYFKRSTYSPSTSAFNTGSPKTPLAALPPPLHSPGVPTPLDANSLANYALELVSEYLAREKREYMLKTKWAKSGRDQLGRDLGDLESTFCLASKSSTSSQAPALLPVFLVLRRTFALPPSPLPTAIIEPYLDTLPAPPDPDEIPFREPTVQTTTAALYVNPRLDDGAATMVLEELIENEKEQVEAAGGSSNQMLEWLTDLVTSVERRFPDGSYSRVFDGVKLRLRDPPMTSNDSELSPQPLAIKPPAHRRAVSTAILSGSPSPGTLSTPRRQHSRSISMPMRQNEAESSDDSEDEVSEPTRILSINDDENSHVRPSTVKLVTSHKELPALDMPSPDTITNNNSPSTTAPTSGWWDLVSAVQPGQASTAPWHDGSIMKRTSSVASGAQLPLPPGAEPAQVIDYAEMDKSYLGTSAVDRPVGPPTPPRQLGSSHRAQTLDTPPRRPPMELGEASTDRPLRSAGAEVTPHSRKPAPTFSPTSTPPVPALPAKSPSPGQANPSHKTKLFSRSMTMKKSKDKENEKANAKKEAENKPTNNPGKWNKDMVANIMGPPASKS